MRLFSLFLGGVLALAAVPVAAQTPDFGDDASIFALNGECDDPRFTGAGMTATMLLDEDRGHDATDCRAAWEVGAISLLVETLPEPEGTLVVDGIDFGDDASEFANDGECDDKRFEGPGMTTTLLLDGDIGHDATDCFTAYEGGELWLAGTPPSPPGKDGDGKTAVRK